MIPKIIHYCWFGGNPLPPLAKKCIKSWKKHCPDYEIIEWNENNFDIASSPLYVRQAYESKKWAFITDYVRLYALINFGGIYMDTDVEVIKPLDRFLSHKAFSGFEDVDSIPTGIMACEKGHPMFKNWICEYDEKLFYNQDGTYNTETNVVAITRIMKKENMRFDNTLQTVADITFYPKDYFCPKDYKTDYILKTKNTHTIHHFSGSWLSNEDKKLHKKWRRQHRMDFWKHAPNRILIQLLGQKKYNKFKSFFGK